MKNYHVLKADGQWKLKSESQSRSIRNFDTKQEAVEFGAVYAKNHGGGSVKIHKTDGTIGEERTYPRSADPKRTQG